MEKVKPNTLYNMDFRDGFNSFDLSDVKLFVTDPPYNIGFQYDNYSDDLPEEEYIELICNFQNIPLAIIHYPEETMKYFVPALGVPDEVIVWAYNSNIGRQSRLINFYGIKPDFRKVKQPYKNPTDKRIAARIAAGHTGAKMYDWFTDIQLVKNVSKEKSNHPCPVPMELMERIILLCTNEGDLICDPFMGKGTTAIAALRTGRKYVGFELSENYWKTSLLEVEKWKNNQKKV